MRSLRTAIEAYAVDANKYPMDWNGQPRAGHNSADEYTSWVQLTTPISYMTSVLFTPFQPKLSARQNNPYSKQNVFEYLGYDYYEFLGQSNPLLLQFVNTLGIKYFFGSFGPSLEDASDLGSVNGLRDLNEGRMAVYDPTNGTISRGDIYGSNVRNFYYQ